MILIIAAKHKFEEQILVNASVKFFLISMAKVFSLSKLLQQKSSKSLNIFAVFPLISAPRAY